MSTDLSDTTTNHINELLQEANRLRYSDTQRSLQLSDKANQLARQAGDARLTVRSLMLMMICHFRMGHNEITIGLGREAQQILIDAPDRAEEIKIVSLMGNAFFAQSDYPKAMNAFSASLDYYRQTGNRVNEAISLTQLGSVHDRLGDYEKALDTHCQSMKISQEIKNRHTEASSSNNIAMIYLQLKDYPNALHYFMMSGNIFRELGDIAFLANTLDNMSEVFDRMGQSEKALESALESLTLHESVADKSGHLILCNLIGGYYFKLGDSRQARRYQIRSIRAARRAGNKFQQAISLRSLGDIWMELKYWKKAESYFTKALGISKTLGTQRLGYEVNERLAGIREAIGDFEGALHFYQSFHSEKEAIFNQESDQRIRTLQIRFDSEQKQRENEIYRLKLDQQQKELHTLARTIAEQNAIIQSFEKNLRRKIPDSGKTSEQALREIIQQFKQNQINAQTWNEFQMRFTAMYPDFVRHLLKINSSLTRQEIRICSLIKTQLSSSRIASILFISKRSVDWHRYQIRKKLELPQESELSQYLSSL